MNQHMPSSELKQDLDNMLSKLNALEIISTDDFQKNMVKIIRSLIQGQIHSINEFEHLKKAMDLLTLQLFDIQNKIKS